MESKHPETELIPYLRGELASPERERLAGHLERCPDCRRAVEAFRELLDTLGRSRPAAPEVHWGRYRAELRAKLEGRLGRERGDRLGARGRRWRRLVPATVAAGVAGAALFLALHGGLRQTGVGDDLTAFEETLIGSRLDLLQQYALLERLDLLEDLDEIRQLDQLSSTTREG